MLEYNRIRWEIDSLSDTALPDPSQPEPSPEEPVSNEPVITMLQHFDYPETWSYEGNAVLSSASKFGKRCVEFVDDTGKAICTNTTGIYNLSANGACEAECFVKADLSGLGGSGVEVSEQDLIAAGYKLYGGHVFKYFSTALTWHNAKTACESLGGHLATSTSAEKDTFLYTVTTEQVWLGATDEETEGTWKWVTGEAWSYTNWSSGEPNNHNKGEHYLGRPWTGTKEWFDAGGGAELGYICEWDSLEAAYPSYFESLGYKFYNGHTFKYFSTAMTWSNAKTACEALGGHLATAPTADKNTFLTTVTTDIIWLGAIDINTDGNWKWVDGEEWSYTNWASGEPYNTSEYEPYLMMNYSETGKWYDERTTGTRAYICEWDYDVRQGIGIGDIMSFGDDLTLGIRSDGKITLQSETWSLDETSSLTMSADTWQHILFRLSNGEASVYLDGALALSGNISGTVITPENLELGGYVGYMDEFVFRDGANTGTPIVPTVAYETGTAPIRGNAPVTRVLWTCEDLPEGLTLSADGKLSGRPTVAGTYTCAVNVTTNWGTASKTINIRVTG